MPRVTLSSEAMDRARRVRLLALDVDGVLTDGSIMLDDQGVETKRFNVRDGQGITAWIRMGYDVALITRRSGMAVQHRAKELGITRIVQGSQNKAEALERLLAETGLTAAQIAYVGDDWPDLPALRRVGLPIAVGDADDRVKSAAMVVTTAAGGRGAVREAIEAILGAQGMMEKAIGIFDV